MVSVCEMWKDCKMLKHQDWELLRYMPIILRVPAFPIIFIKRTIDKLTNKEKRYDEEKRR
jgi:hypothetical protein